MRYYDIQITNSETGQPILQADGKTPFGPYTSYKNGANISGALNVEFDIPVFDFADPISAAFLRIWGIGLTALGQSTQFNPNQDFSQYCDIKIYGGMSKGLPLANPTQSGLLLDGAIYQAFGNWQGTEQTVDFQIINNGGGTGNYGSATNPKNIILKWQSGQKLGDAITLALKTAFPKAKITDLTSSKLTLPYDPQPGAYQTVNQLAQYVYNTSQSVINKPGYLGVKIVPTQDGFKLFDGSSPSEPKQILFNDLIGQPTWLNIATINFKTVMRADIAVSDYIKMPQTTQINTTNSFSQYRSRATFQGKFLVTAVRHIGHFRQASADSWVTSIDAVSADDVTAP